MKVNFKKFLYDVDGKEIGTLGEFCKKALLSGCVGDEKASISSKVDRFDLAMEIINSEDGNVDLKVDQIKVIKDAVSNSIMRFTPLIVGQVDHILEGEDCGLGPKDKEIEEPIPSESVSVEGDVVNE